MAGASSYTNYADNADDFYFSALCDEDELFPISVERYAAEMQLQEVLMSSVLSYCLVRPPRRHSHYTSGSGSGESLHIKRRTEKGESSSSASQTDEAAFCEICAEVKPRSEMFRNKMCRHAFCNDCIGRHIAAKVQENISTVRCPHVGCQGVLEPEFCQEVIPAAVFERWVGALCESLVLGSRGIYCPFKDCSAFLLDDDGVGERVIRESECPSCRRLFCAQCKVPWHADVSCDQYQCGGSSTERRRNDLMLEQLAATNNWRRCPKCKFYVDKTQGCLHITCRCGFEFYYGCGSTWGTHAGGCRG